MVTGKNKKQFEEWYIKEFCNDISFMLYSDEIKLFNSLHFEMQIGVYLAYYDSLGINIDVMWIFAASSYSWEIENITGELGQMSEHCAGFNTRNEAYKEAFKQADKLINEKI